jgi:diacylglycerol kinase (ATP)
MKERPMSTSRKAFLVRRERNGKALSRRPVSGPAGAQRVVAILNPAKNGYTEAKAHLIVECTGAGWPMPTFLDTTVEDPGRGQAEAALGRGVDVLVAGGGDGTIRAVAEVLVERKSRVPLAVLPLGTGNLLARNLGMPVSNGQVQRNVRTALFGWERKIDTVRMTATLDDSGVEVSHVSLIFSGIGFDAAMITATRGSLKKRLGPLGWLAYAEAGLRQVQGTRERIPVTISYDGGDPESHDVVSVMIGNGSSIPAGIEVVPGALLDDGGLDIVIVAPASLHDWARVAAKLVTRHKWDVSQLQYHRCQRAEIRSANPVPAQLDGDPLGTTRLVVAEILPGSLTVRSEPPALV